MIRWLKSMENCNNGVIVFESDGMVFKVLVYSGYDDIGYVDVTEDMIWLIEGKEELMNVVMRVYGKK